MQRREFYRNVSSFYDISDILAKERTHGGESQQSNQKQQKPSIPIPMAATSTFVSPLLFSNSSTHPRNHSGKQRRIARYFT